MTREAIYSAWLAADEAWSAEGIRIFGKAWGDRRYTTAGQGGANTELRKHYEAFHKWRMEWERVA